MAHHVPRPRSIRNLSPEELAQFQDERPRPALDRDDERFDMARDLADDGDHGLCPVAWGR